MRDTTKAPVEFTNLAKDTVLRFMEMQGDESLAVASRLPARARSIRATRSR